MESTGFGLKAYNAAKMAAVVDVLLAEGVAPSDALEGADIRFDDLHLASTRISRDQLIQCYRNAVALSRDPHLPYTIGSNVHLSAYGMYGYAMLCSTDFRRTMDFAVRYHQLATPLATIGFDERSRPQSARDVVDQQAFNLLPTEARSLVRLDDVAIVDRRQVPAIVVARSSGDDG